MSLRWRIQEGNMDGIILWSWLKVIFESTEKLDPLRRLHSENV